MTMPVSKMVVDRQKSSEAVQAAATTHEAAIVKGTIDILGDDAGVAVSLILNRSKERLKEATDKMVAADNAHLTELSDDKEKLIARDDKGDALYRTISDFKEIGTAVFGSTYIGRLGLKGKTPQDPVALARLAGLLLENMGNQSTPSPRMGVSLNMEGWKTALETGRAELSDALSAVALERREAEATQVAKNDAVTHYDKVFTLTATLASTLLDTAGETALAKRVRPSSRRSGQTTEAVEIEESTESAE